MNRQFGWVAGSIFSLVTFGSALAADLPLKAPPAPLPPAVYNWSGGYIGGNIGWANSSGGSGETCTSGPATSVGCAIVPDSGLHANGALAGVQSGYNWQSGMWVYGIESDFQVSHVKGSSLAIGTFPDVGGGFSPPASYSADQNMDWFGTTRGRIGAAFNNVLIYGTGGVMYGEVQTTQNLQFNSGIIFPAQSNTIRSGWVGGGGIEWAVVQSLSLKFEGLYYDLGSITTAATQVPGTSTFTNFKTFGFHGAIARVGFNYKLDPPVVAKY